MASEWESTHFGEICDHSAFGPRFSGELYKTGGNVATLRTTDISEDGTIDHRTMPLAELDLDKFRHHFLQKDDLVITRSGRVGTVALFKHFEKPVLPGAFLIRFRLNRNIADPTFYKYFFNSPTGRERVLSTANGSVQQNLNITSLHQLDVPIPPLREQRAIAQILRTLDDKIELNRKINDTLESIARALFKSWFVDFDPVRAGKAEGTEPLSPSRIADLFPDSFQSSEAGNIPSGWSVVGLDKIGRFLNGLALQKFPAEGDRYLPVIKIVQLRTEDTSDTDKASADLPLDYVVEDGDVLFSWSGSLECVLWTGGQGALNQHLFKVTSQHYPKWFYFLWVQTHLPEFRRIASGKATTMGHIQRGHLSAAKVLIPDPALLKEMDRFFAPLIEQIVNLKLSSRTLAAIRNALIPKLISGELRVPFAERIVGGHV